ncbi:deazapurine DNA modification protein DpdA family protein [Nocardia salmonicida]|uniref:deazapurine DNA modification protein DpdA family protein n=1 Tax=Nocardia salmonicida TaxID=53431 RepID=UPI0007A3CA61|nr:hypothetical protein [Nocardia salmonicida]MBC7299434.1 hypothetical protein [Nocardia sp.]
MHTEATLTSGDDMSPVWLAAASVAEHSPTPWTRSHDDLDPARRMTFYLGTGHPHHLNTSGVPLFLSAAALARYRGRGERFPIRMTGGAPWAGDSGAYAALILSANPNGHPWTAHPDDYGALWTRLIDSIGPPDFVGIQDLPCEAQCLARTGATVAEQFPHVPWLRTLQGWHPDDYVDHYLMYLQAGVSMTGETVGIGSVCRRGSQHAVAEVVETLAPLGMRLHGFGLSLGALRLIGHQLSSSDTQGWSYTARRQHIRLPGCTHTTRPDPVTGTRTPTDCRNCIRWARAYRERALDAVRHAAATAAARTTTAPTVVASDPATQCRAVARPRPGSRAITAPI